MAQISLSLSGAFCPTSFPLFQGWRLQVAKMFMTSPPRVEGQGWLNRGRVANRPRAAHQLRRLLLSAVSGLSAAYNVRLYE